jgi:hypothetical protein
LSMAWVSLWIAAGCIMLVILLTLDSEEGLLSRPSLFGV